MTEKLKIFNLDGSVTEVEPLKMWEPGDFPLTDMVICYVHHCENCQSKNKEAFPYCVRDREGKYWEWICNACYDELGCEYPVIDNDDDTPA